MKVNRTLAFAALIGAGAATAFFAGSGLLSAFGLIVGAFDITIVLGVLLALLTEDVDKRTLASWATRARALRNRRVLHKLCTVCARPVIDTGAIRICRACDRIPATLTA
jgi:hypothetical protein